MADSATQHDETEGRSHQTQYDETEAADETDSSGPPVQGRSHQTQYDETETADETDSSHSSGTPFQRDHQTQHNEIFDDTFVDLEHELQDNNEQARMMRKRPGRPLMSADFKRFKDDSVYTPSDSELGHLLLAIESSSSHAEAKQVMSDFLNSYKEQGIELDIPLETMAALSTQVSRHTIRENIARLEAELAGPHSSSRRDQLEKELHSYRRIFDESYR